MTQPLTALIARLDEAAAWLEVHPPVHPATRSAADALGHLRAVIDAGLGPYAAEAAGTFLSFTAAGTESLAAGLPEQDDELAGLVREIGRLWRELEPNSSGRKRRRGPSAAPLFAIVGARPVRTAPRIDGSVDILAFDWHSGRLVRDPSMLEAVLAPAGRDVDVVDVTVFYETVRALRQRRGLGVPAGPTRASALGAAVDWLGTGQAAMPYRAEVDGDEWMVRVNDWPDHPAVYTLFVNGREIFSFDGWSDTWSRP